MYDALRENLESYLDSGGDQLDQDEDEMMYQMLPLEEVDSNVGKIAEPITPKPAAPSPTAEVGGAVWSGGWLGPGVDDSSDAHWGNSWNTHAPLSSATGAGTQKGGQAGAHAGAGRRGQAHAHQGQACGRPSQRYWNCVYLLIMQGA